jgi:hypothetical protein
MSQDVLPHRAHADALLARWRATERLHAGTVPGSPEWEASACEIVEDRRRYQAAFREISPSAPPVPSPERRLVAGSVS